MTIEATLTRIAEALETIATNGQFARSLMEIRAELVAAQGTGEENTTPLQAEPEKPKSGKKGGRPAKDATPAEPGPTAQDPNTLPLLPGDLPIAPAAPVVAETPAPVTPVVEAPKVFTYDDMVTAAHAYAAVGTRETITAILAGLDNASKLKDVPEALYGQAIDKFNAALAAVNKSADAIGF